MPYWLTLLLTAAILGGMTVTFVLFVLPPRYVFQGGLRVSGVSFPTGSSPFEPGAWTLRAPAVRTVPIPSPQRPAGLLWDQVLPLLAREGHEAAPPLFRSYLEAHSGDASVQMEYAVTLPMHDAGPVTVPATGPPDVADVEGAVEPSDPLEQARLALFQGDLDRARTLYRSALEENPDDPALLQEWADVLQYRFEDTEGALRALRTRAELVAPTPAERFRIATLSVWTGDQDAAEAELLAALEARPDHASAWALLGELRRWAGDRRGAGAAYRRALALDPEEPIALGGNAALAEATERAIRSVDDPRYLQTLQIFRDSDGFGRTEVRASGHLVTVPHAVSVEVGARRLEGVGLDGTPEVDQGGLVEATAVRWWNGGGLRGSITLGAEYSRIAGVDPLVEVGLRARELHGWNLAGTLRRAPAHPLTSTLESIVAGVRSEQVGLDVYRGFPAGMELSGSLDAGRLKGDGTTVRRFGSAVTLSRGVTRWLRAGTTSRIVAVTAPAPTPGGRRLFWDPELFWRSGVLVELRTPRDEDDRVSFHLRSSPGVALSREREADGYGTVRQLEMEGGLRLQGDRASVVADFFFGRGREGGYTSRGMTLGLEMRP